jgi:uncharacterized membrane protein
LACLPGGAEILPGAAETTHIQGRFVAWIGVVALAIAGGFVIKFAPQVWQQLIGGLLIACAALFAKRARLE